MVVGHTELGLTRPLGLVNNRVRVAPDRPPREVSRPRRPPAVDPSLQLGGGHREQLQSTRMGGTEKRATRSRHVVGHSSCQLVEDGTIRDPRVTAKLGEGVQVEAARRRLAADARPADGNGRLTPSAGRQVPVPRGILTHHALRCRQPKVWRAHPPRRTPVTARS